ncbi:hypothetical protein ACHAXS_000559 [Conticribra weissflogii]
MKKAVAAIALTYYFLRHCLGQWLSRSFGHAATFDNYRHQRNGTGNRQSSF